MRLATIEDRAWIESVCNSPAIRVWVHCDGAGPCNALPYLTPPSFSIVGEEGCFLGQCLEPGRYAVHTNIMPGYRGSKAIRAAEEAIAIAFLSRDATELVTMVPHVIPHAKLVARAVGFHQRFTRHRAWPVDGQLYSIDFLSLSIDDWIFRGRCVSAGEAFHARLHGELGQPAHGHDFVHDCYVGAAVEMVRHGQPKKAVAVYNRWARFAGYQPVKIVSEHPLRIDIRQCVIKVEEDQFTIEEALHA